MPQDPTSFRQRLFESQEVTPPLRAAYEQDLDAILHEVPSGRNRFLAGILLVIMLGIVVGEVRALFVHQGDFSFYAGAVTMLVACCVGSVRVVRDLCSEKVERKSAHQVSEMFYGVAAILTVTALIRGMGAAGDPASTFGAFFVFVLLFVCSIWALGNRITASEMAMKEQVLRLECRVADLSERLKS